MATTTQTQVETTAPASHAEQHGQLRPVTIDANGVLETPDGNVKPNIGRTISDVEAIGPESMPLAQWQRENNIDVAKQIKLVKLAHMRYQHTDIEGLVKFLRDFGMRVVKRDVDAGGKERVWFGGYGVDQFVYFAQSGSEKAFLGGCFEVESHEELEKAAQLPEAEGLGGIVDLGARGEPGGGFMLTLKDPEGFLVNLLYGQEPARVEREAFPPKLVANDELDKPRVRQFNRFTPGPAAVHKLGHYGLCLTKFDEQVDWYTRTFNLVPSDFQYIPHPNGKEGERLVVALFAHIDRGEEPVDHHTFFMSRNEKGHVHHCSFEVHDYDTQHLGHQWLAKQGWKSVWGIGRHILGSQIFDYWWDSSGNMIEHYADGDLVNCETPVGWGMAGHESLAVWGPEVPKWFLE
ncbi:Glyoxalase/Bleomycin resistance protein/Dioxygenase superfamily [Teratosphaeria destructans]|uniref:Glyoxalase/Bleomycin resistance protein/Dioxygenase superfamily n=1 Tax=Teratosphaeria destructans TaxID=418781 RepID=A0A9W7W0P7_9PEZI|nr:Glyoxalase/Bleomycin resistance protein/Dioxygenase superfamily [Teratosphaeria destructans]